MLESYSEADQKGWAMDAFISYMREDSQLIERLANDFRACGIKFWLDRNEILPGDYWQIGIQAAIERGTFFIACFSNSFELRSNTYMKEEIDLAVSFFASKKLGRRWLLPVSLDGKTPPAILIREQATLRDLHFLDMSENWSAAVSKLISLISPKSVEWSQKQVKDAAILLAADVLRSQLSDPLLLKKSSHFGPAPDASGAALYHHARTVHMKRFLPAFPK